MLSSPPSPSWLPFLKMIFGFLLLAVLLALGLCIALGHVKAETSYGLGIILGSLSTLAGGFVGWAFKDKQEAQAKEG